MARTDCQWLTATTERDSSSHLRVELPAPVLLRLLSEGSLYAIEFRSLDVASHRLARKLVLQSCIERLKRTESTRFPSIHRKGGNHEHHRP